MLETLSGLTDPDCPGPADLRTLLMKVDVTPELLDATNAPLPHRPYGRKVLLNTAGLEGMIAQWNPGVPCAVHDHGRSVGAVRVLAGSGIHRQYHVKDGKLLLVAEDTIQADDILQCGPTFVHAMESSRHEALITLHLYGAREHGPTCTTGSLQRVQQLLAVALHVGNSRDAVARAMALLERHRQSALLGSAH